MSAHESVVFISSYRKHFSCDPRVLWPYPPIAHGLYLLCTVQVTAGMRQTLLTIASSTVPSVTFHDITILGVTTSVDSHGNNVTTIDYQIDVASSSQANSLSSTFEYVWSCGCRETAVLPVCDAQWFVGLS